jgi:hypothetical protein
MVVLALVFGAPGCAGAVSPPTTLEPGPPANVRGGIAGVVENSASSEPLANAIVLLEGGGAPSTTRETTTDSAGRFMIRDVPAGTYSLRVLYGEDDVTRIVVHDGATGVRANFSIDPLARPLLCCCCRVDPYPIDRSLLDDDAASRLLHGPRVIHRL